jgi:prepilin-type processing-associated H-X9-DG protein
MTLLLGEALTSPDGLGWVSGTRATLRNTSAIEESRPYLAPAQAQARNDEKEKAGSLFVGGFGSHHPGGLNIGLADGSSRFLSRGTEPTVLRLLGNRADGEIVKPF